MSYIWSCLQLLCLLCWSVQGQSGNGLLQPVSNLKPATCTASYHIMVGSDVKWKITETGVISEENCTFTDLESQNVFNSSSFMSALPGEYSYECLGTEGNMTLVDAQYSLAICRGCTSEHRAAQGDVVQWSFVGDSECATEVRREGEVVANIDEDTRSLRLEAPGRYTITCAQNTDLNTTIIVVKTTRTHQELLYTHAALMALAFGVLLPIGAFLAHNKVTLAHKVIQPLGVLLALSGLVLVIVYVQLNDGGHFGFLIHSTVGLVLLLMATVGMPLLLLKKPRIWHKKLGQVVVFFGLGNILLGLSIFPVQPVVAISLCAIYGLWLVIIILAYVFIPRPNKKVSSYSLNANKLDNGPEDQAYKSRNSSFSSLKGPQRLEKNIISDDKMIQLRKKSMDFLDSRTRTRDLEQLNLEFQHHPLYNKPILENGDCYSDEERGSKPDQESDYDLDTSRAPLCLQDSSYPAAPDELDSDEKVRMYLQRTRDQSADYTEDSCDELDPRPRTKVTRAHTFNHKSGGLLGEVDERGGSLRITRHSKRARPSANEVFPSILSEDQPEAQQKLSTLPTQQPASKPERRRKGAFIPPPIITTTPVDTTDSPVITGCPFHGGLAARPNQRGISPTPSGDSVFDNSPRPQRKKKVSVAQIEATVVPNTPVNLLPPPGSSLRHSVSHDTMRTHQDVFTDNAFRSVMQISQDAIVCANSVGDIVFWSAGASSMFGYTPGEAIGSNLEMIVPMSYREKHRGGINKRTGDTLKYLRKHSYAPEEQKHARLYEVRALTKSGHEIPAEVHVTSFVIEEELFYTGVITEMSRKTGGSIGGSTSDINELSLKQRALAVGAQMKLAHNLMNANYISKSELERVLVSSLKAADFEVESHQTEQMVAGIMKEGDPDSSGVISFVNLIKLLSKHQLYISESGNIARYGKTKGAEANSTRGQRLSNRITEFFTKSATCLVWLLLYLLLNIFVLVVGVLVDENQGLVRFAYGAGPVLSMNCVFVLLPTLSSVVTALRSIVWMNKYLPLKSPNIMHIIVSIFILFWSLVHTATHFASFTIQAEADNATDNIETLDTFKINIHTNLMPVVTGLVLFIVLAVIWLSAIVPIRKAARFIPFYILHWVLLVMFYALLVVHGVKYFNHSFWKWLLPLAAIVVFERIYRYAAVKRHHVKVKSAGRYDDQSRTAIIELEKPARFKFEPGQYILLNLPWIGQFKWQECQISSGPKDQKLTVHIPYSSDPWFSQTFNYLKQHPYNMPSAAANQTRNGKQKNKENVPEMPDDSHPAARHPVTFTGPFGPTGHCTQLYDYKVSMIVCSGGPGPHIAKAVIKKFLEYRKGSSCHCGCTPALTRLYFIWVVPSGNDFEWFSDYLSELCEDDHVHRYLDVRVFLTNINSPPDELASALLQLGIKAAGPTCIVRRPSQPQLNNLHSKTSYGLPDFPALLDYISAQNAALWGEKETDFGVFTVGNIHCTVERELSRACVISSKPGQLSYTFQHVYS